MDFAPFPGSYAYLGLSVVRLRKKERDEGSGVSAILTSVEGN